MRVLLECRRKNGFEMTNNTDMEKIEWPPHYEVHENHRADMSRYLPEVVAAMHAQGMTTIRHLADRIKYMMAIDALREEFGEVSARQSNTF